MLLGPFTFHPAVNTNSSSDVPNMCKKILGYFHFSI